MASGEIAKQRQVPDGRITNPASLAVPSRTLPIPCYVLWTPTRSVSPAVPLRCNAAPAYHWVVTLHLSECPADLEKVAEAYVMGTLPEEQAIAFEDHYAACDTCATALYKTADYVDRHARRRAKRATHSYHRRDLPTR